MDLYYELTETGYHIYNRNDALFHVHQYEPFIPHPELTYEENAQLQIHYILNPDDAPVTEADYLEALREMGVELNEG